VADYFTSYTSSDRDWALWLHRELERVDHKLYIHEREIRPGEGIFAWMRRRMDTVDLVLCVLSGDYLKAACSTAERNAALWEAIGSRPGFALAIVADSYRAMWWIRAEMDATMRADLVALGVRLDWVPADETEGAALKKVMERLDAGLSNRSR
jgi:hypothetical protein